MTEPNIVYIGDEVQYSGPNWLGLWEDGSVVGGGDDYLVTLTNSGDFKFFRTPDGRPVDGFGGARIEVRRSPVFGDCGGDSVSHYSPAVFINDVMVASDYRECEGDDPLADGLRIACDLYGEWVREPTEADLKRRGLL